MKRIAALLVLVCTLTACTGSFPRIIPPPTATPDPEQTYREQIAQLVVYPGSQTDVMSAAWEIFTLFEQRGRELHSFDPVEWRARLEQAVDLIVAANIAAVALQPSRQMENFHAVVTGALSVCAAAASSTLAAYDRSDLRGMQQAFLLFEECVWRLEEAGALW